MGHVGLQVERTREVLQVKGQVVTGACMLQAMMDTLKSNKCGDRWVAIQSRQLREHAGCSSLWNPRWWFEAFNCLELFRSTKACSAESIPTQCLSRPNPATICNHLGKRAAADHTTKPIRSRAASQLGLRSQRILRPVAPTTVWG